MNDQYPGDEVYFQKVDELLQAVRKDELEYSLLGEGFHSKTELVQILLDSFYSIKYPTMDTTAAEWVGLGVECKSELKELCLASLDSSENLNMNYIWSFWTGSHSGNWHQVDRVFNDYAIWSPIKKQKLPKVRKVLKGLSDDLFDTQKVVWPGRVVGKRGWNQSHPSLSHLWGWDPKESGNEAGGIGTHLGFPGQFEGKQFIIWLTPGIAFFEMVQEEKTDERTINGSKLRGRAKGSVSLGKGCGQWLVC